MKNEDSVALSQLVGAIKRARRTVYANGGQIRELAKRNAGTHAELICEGGVKSLLTGVYWLDQAIGTLEIVTKRTKKEARHA